MFKKIIIFSICIIIALLSAIYILFQQPSSSYRGSSRSLLAQQAAVGRAVINASRRDPAVAAAVRTAVELASEEDRDLAAEIITTISKN